jgi:hypothetical protein
MYYRKDIAKLDNWVIKTLWVSGKDICRVFLIIK